MKHLLFAFALLVSIASCKKDENTLPPDTRPDCEKNHTGSIRFSNVSEDPYNCYIDGSFKGVCNQYTFLLVENVSAGYHTYRVLQVSGYIFYPTDLNASGTVTECYEYSYKFP